jgi:predicted  nucleic acid-binding Zn-ribbon protein
MSATVKVEVGAGELIDKITILQIKSDRITDEAKLVNIRHELDVLSKTRDEQMQGTEELVKLSAELKTINEAIWEIEDDIRECESRKDFGETFIELARGVYHTNDKRAAVKKQINLLTGSDIIEEKSYTDYS